MLNGAVGLETVEFMAARIDDFGTPAAYNHYAVGWAHAMDTPYQWTKQVASHWGGTRNGTIVHWPNGIKAKGEIRSQFHHVIDVAATVLEAAGLPEPTSSTACSRRRSQGVAHGVLFDDAQAPTTGRRPSTSRCSCNRGIYHKGWTAVTRHSIPWVGRRDARASTTTSGSSTARTTGRRRTTSRRSSPEKLPRAAAAVHDRGGEVQRASRSTTGASSASTRTWRAGRSSSRASRRCCSAAWAD